MPKISPKAADVVADVIADGWKQAVAGQLSKALSDGFWDEGPRRQRYRLPECKPLADLANALEKTKKNIKAALGEVTGRGLKWLGRPPHEQRLAEAFARKIPLPGEDGLKALVRSLRLTGIWICIKADKDVFAECPCFLPVAKDKTEGELKAALEKKLDVIASERDNPAMNQPPS